MNARKNGESTVVPSVEPADSGPKTNGVHNEHAQSLSSSPAKREAESEPVSEVTDPAPPKKKQKANIDADAAYAARLQAEEDKLARPTRGGANRKAPPVKRKKKKPSKKERVTGSDDSDAEDEERKAQKPKRDTGFHVCGVDIILIERLTRYRNLLTSHQLCPIFSMARYR